MFGPPGLASGFGGPGNGAAWGNSGGHVQNQPRRPLARPVRGHFVFLRSADINRKNKQKFRPPEVNPEKMRALTLAGLDPRGSALRARMKAVPSDGRHGA